MRLLVLLNLEPDHPDPTPKTLHPDDPKPSSQDSGGLAESPLHPESGASFAET